MKPDIANVNDSNVVVYDDSIGNLIRDTHKEVSNLKTPSAYVFDKMGMDYVKYPYMRDIADKHYPGWSWTIISTQMLGDKAFVVHGRLKWCDKGVWREGDMVAAHRIQKLTQKDDYVNIGNDIKAANTDCMKKAFNVFLNIADDIYKAQIEDAELTDEQVDEILNLSKKVSKAAENQAIEMMEAGTVNGINYKGYIAKLKRKLKA